MVTDQEVMGAALRRVNELRRVLGLPELEKLPKGRRGHPRLCPIARAFRPFSAKFDAGTLIVCNRQVVWKLIYESELQCFARYFDSGDLPELERWFLR